MRKHSAKENKAKKDKIRYVIAARDYRLTLIEY